MAVLLPLSPEMYLTRDLGWGRHGPPNSSKCRSLERSDYRGRQSDLALGADSGRSACWAELRRREGRHVDATVVVGDDCKVENFASIYRGVTIGNRVFVGPHVCFTNDTYPRAVSPEWKVLPTKVENGASIGANATILCGLTIGRNAMVAA